MHANGYAVYTNVIIFYTFKITQEASEASHAKNGTAAWNLPILSTRSRGREHLAIRRYGTSPGFTAYYQDVEYYRERKHDKQAVVSFLVWLASRYCMKGGGL